MYRVRPSIVLLVVLLLAAGAFLLRLINLRFQDPGLHPPYSTLRFDPIGAHGFHDALDEIPGFVVERNFKPVGRWAPDANSTYYFLNIDPGYAMMFSTTLSGFDESSILGQQNVDTLLKIPAAGGRLVLTFAPQPKDASFLDDDMVITAPPVTPATGDDDDDDDGSATATTDTAPATTDSATATVDPSDTTEDTTVVSTAPNGQGTQRVFHVEGSEHAYETLGFKIDFYRDGSPRTIPPARPGPDAPEGFQPLAWHTNLHFTDLSADWRVIYAWRGLPVIIERDYEEGTIVLAADSFPFSNEALAAKANTGLLAWSVGDHGRAVFDETHLGVISHTGFAGLARRYRLHGLASGLLLLAILFIWKNATSLVPAQSPFDESSQLIRTDYDVNSGYVNLLRRHISSLHLVRTCFDQWRASLPASRDDHRRQIAKIEDIFAAESGETVVDRRPVQTYNAIRRILAERKRRK